MTKAEMDKRSELENLFGKSVVVVCDREPFQSVSVKRLDSIRSELMAMDPLLTPILFLSTSCYQVDEALDLVSHLQNNNRHYEVIVPARLGSLGTVLSLGAEKIYMTRMGALSSIDATLSGHGYPNIFLNSIHRRINLAELSELRAFFQSVVDYDPNLLSSIEEEIEKYIPSSLGLRAKKRELELKDKLLRIIKVPSGLVNPEDFVSFLLRGAGSFDYWMYYRELKRIGLKVELIPSREEQKVLKINKVLQG